MKHWDPIINRLPQDRPLVGVELGTLGGKTAEALLGARSNLTLYMVDRWREFPPDHRYRASGHQEAQHPDRVYRRHKKFAQRRTAFAADRAQLIEAETAEAAKRFDDHSVDFVCIDADSTYEGTLENLEAWRSKVRPGGFLTGLSASHPDPEQVDRAVHDFVQRHGLVEHLYHDANTTWFIYPPEPAQRQWLTRTHRAGLKEHSDG